MFAFTEKFRSRAAAKTADTIDLLIEFATLGEYGLEHPEPPTAAGCPGTTRTRRRQHERGPGRGQTTRRHPAGPCRIGQPRRHRPTDAFPEALRPPRVQPRTPA